VFRRRDLLREIAGFRAAGGATALVSDYPARLKLDALAARDLFDVVLANGESAEVVALKPDPRSLLAAAAKLGVAPEQCLVIGDRPDADGAAAQAAGMAFRRIG
jgi:HAD superfamily hydrolase (TIGR01509 family)